MGPRLAPTVLDGPINGDWFDAYVAQVLAPTLRAGDVVVMDNLSSHKRASVRAMIEAKGARLAFLPQIIRLAVMLYVRFLLSPKNVEGLLHEDGSSSATRRFW